MSIWLVRVADSTSALVVAAPSEDEACAWAGMRGVASATLLGEAAEGVQTGVIVRGDYVKPGSLLP